MPPKLSLYRLQGNVTFLSFLKRKTIENSNQKSNFVSDFRVKMLIFSTLKRPKVVNYFFSPKKVKLKIVNFCVHL